MRLQAQRRKDRLLKMIPDSSSTSQPSRIPALHHPGGDPVDQLTTRHSSVYFTRGMFLRSCPTLARVHRNVSLQTNDARDMEHIPGGQ